MRTSFFTILVILLFGMACMRQLPKTTYEAYSLDWRIVQEADTTFLLVQNPVACPLFLVGRSDEEVSNSALIEQTPITMDPYEVIKLPLPAASSLELLESSVRLYSIAGGKETIAPDTTVRYRYPFPKGRTYPVIQAYGGTFSHKKSAFAYYAIDFELEIGDTVCAARDGIVVGLIEDNPNWVHGANSGYREYANYLRLFHEDQTYTDYVHLKREGALVELGDTVRAGQPIGISGYTGWTSTPHLHFNTVMPTDTGTLVGYPVQFEEMAGKDIKEGMQVGHR